MARGLLPGEPVVAFAALNAANTPDLTRLVVAVFSVAGASEEDPGRGSPEARLEV